MQQWGKTFQPKGIGKIKHMKVTVLMEDASGSFYVTDIMFQGGNIATTWVGHPSEIKWSFDNE